MSKELPEHHGGLPPERPSHTPFATWYSTGGAPAGWNGETHSAIFRARSDGETS